MAKKLYFWSSGTPKQILLISPSSLVRHWSIDCSAWFSLNIRLKINFKMCLSIDLISLRNFNFGNGHTTL